MSARPSVLALAGALAWLLLTTPVAAPALPATASLATPPSRGVPPARARPPANAAPLSTTALASTLGLAAGPRRTGAGSAGTATNSETPVPVAASEVPPPGRRLSSEEVLEIANHLPRMRHVRAAHRGSYGGAYLKGPDRWQVSYFAHGGAEIGQVIISDLTGRVLEQWTGPQVAWTMARGYPGAFGRHVNALYVWLPLCALFLAPFIEWRRPWALRHLDLLALLGFSVSLAYFNHAELYKSVPLVYPPLVYLLVRMVLLAFRRPPPAPVEPAALPPPPLDGEVLRTPAAPAPARDSAREPLRLWIPAPYLAVGVVFLLGFRIGLNVTDSNVIDVGYAGVVGASKIVHGRPLYGGYPSDNEHGDTYGPVAYEAYVPFEQLFGWSGTWDDLPAAHAAAIVFDLLAVALMFALGVRIRGPTLGVALAYAWVSYPFTLYALESNSNDTLVAVLVLATLLVASSSPARGVGAALAGLTKLAPLALAPLLATHGLRELPSAGRRARALVLFGLAFAVTVAVVAVPALTHDSLHEIYERTLVYQANRGAPFSVWGLYGGWHRWEIVAQVAAVALALGLALVRGLSPRPPGGDSIPALAAACAAVLIAVQLTLEYWFYLYIPWFFGAAMVALLASATPPAAPPAGASAPAQSSLLEDAASNGSPPRSATGPPQRSGSAPATA